MYCTGCGIELSDDANFCSRCGKATAVGQACMVPPKQLVRYMPEKKIAGVCAGVARYFCLDVTLVRLVWLILVFFPIPGGILAYIIAWIVLPKEYGPAEAATGTQLAPV